ncbi:MAG: hypothetical protein KDI37_09645 [Xanthomonadales bacterium]|nr:hypothetical protein [Xanthomonadales bacterium]
MAKSFRLGYEGALYIANNALNHTEGDSDPPTPLYDFTTVTWSELTNIGDVDTGGDPETVDTTTRATARTGFSSEIDVIEKGELTFPIQFDPSDANFKKLLQAKINKTEVALMDLTEQVTVIGAIGLVGNFTINFGQKKPVKGVQVIEVRAKLIKYSDWVEVVDDGGATLQRVAFS